MWGKVSFPLLLFGSSVFELATQDSQVFTVVKPDIICTFLIHYGSLQKMLTYSFNFVWNTQKSKCAISFENPGKMFLSIENVFKKISEDQP